MFNVPSAVTLARWGRGSAVVQSATLPCQRVVEGTLSTLPGLARAEGIAPPALLIVGEVVRLREKLAWFADRCQAPISKEDLCVS